MAAINKEERPIVTAQGATVLNSKREDMKMKIFMTRMEQVVQRSCRCPVPGSVQGKVG